MSEASDDIIDLLIQYENDLYDQRRIFEKMSEVDLKFHVGELFKCDYKPDKYTTIVQRIISKTGWSEKQKNVIINHLVFHDYFSEELFDKEYNNGDWGNKD